MLKFISIMASPLLGYIQLSKHLLLKFVPNIPALNIFCSLPSYFSNNYARKISTFLIITKCTVHRITQIKWMIKLAFSLVLVKPERNMLKILWIIPSSTSQKLMHYSYLFTYLIRILFFCINFQVCIDIQVENMDVSIFPAKLQE